MPEAGHRREFCQPFLLSAMSARNAAPNDPVTDAVETVPRNMELCANLD